MAEIRVTRTAETTFHVEVKDASSMSVHDVTASSAEIQRYGGEVSPESLIEKSFEFLLEREPKESILRSFELSVIERYFPEYGKEIKRRFK